MLHPAVPIICSLPTTARWYPRWLNHTYGRIFFYPQV
eukprot:SAG11_NODE_33397_length_277_cov_1.168539_2_plen_36_part_01